MQEAPAFGAPNRLKMIDPIAPPDARQHLVLFRPPLRRNDNPDVLSDCLFRRVAQDALGGGIPGRNCPVESFADNNVVRGIDYCCKVSSFGKCKISQGSRTSEFLSDFHHYLNDLQRGFSTISI